MKIHHRECYEITFMFFFFGNSPFEDQLFDSCRSVRDVSAYWYIWFRWLMDQFQSKSGEDFDAAGLSANPNYLKLTTSLVSFGF
jgi:hypothetical protein